MDEEEEDLKTTTIEITPEMEQWKKKFIPWREGGPNWQKIMCAGIMRWQQSRKFGDEEELHDNVGKYFKVA